MRKTKADKQDSEIRLVFKIFFGCSTSGYRGEGIHGYFARGGRH